MPLKPKDLTDEEILRFLRFSVTESGSSTFTQQEIDTQLSIERGMIWLMKFIEIDFAHTSLDDVGAGASESIMCQVTRDSKTAEVHLDDSDVLFKVKWGIDRTAAIGTDAGPAYWQSVSPIVNRYTTPLPYASQKIYISVLSTAGAAKTARGRIGYVLRSVNEKYFMRVAHALLG